MKKSIAIYLSKDLLETIDELAIDYKSRSAFIEFMLQKEISQRIRAAQNAKDLKFINQHADRPNQEAEDVLAYQKYLQ